MIAQENPHSDLNFNAQRLAGSPYPLLKLCFKLGGFKLAPTSPRKLPIGKYTSTREALQRPDALGKAAGGAK